jgi:hypothetical protein
LRIAEEKSEERDLRDKDVVMVNLKAREEVEEEELVSKESQEKSNLLNQRLQQKQSQLDCLYINYRAEI